MTTENKTPTNEDKLYAGKFKTVEELEEGYKHSLPVHQENERLKQELAQHNAPEEYLTPDGVTLDGNELTQIKITARNAKMTQAQYDQLVKSQVAKIAAQEQAFEAAKKEVGPDRLNMLQDFVNKHYPEYVRADVLKKLIVDKDARQAAFKDRESKLNSSLPGMEKPGGVRYSVAYEDVLTARDAAEKAPHDMKKRNAYLGLMKEYAAQNAANKEASSAA